MDKTVGFIDVGTNSIHMLVVRFFDNALGTPVYQDKEAVRLGRSLYSGGKVDEETLSKVSRVFSSFSTVARRFGATEILACATCAAREMPNPEALVRLAEENGISLRVISGPEEAHLTRLGVLGPVAPRRTLLVDIGGGSTEVTIADGSEDLVSESLKIGALRMAFGTPVDQSGKISSEDYDYLRRIVDNEVSSVSRRVKELGFDTAIGSSGTLMAIASAIAARRGDGDDSYFTYSELERLMRYLCRMDSEQRSRLSKVGGSRADIIIGGGAVAEELMFNMGIDRIEISPNGLREGMRVAYLLENGWHNDDVRGSSVVSLAGRFGTDRLHGDTVRRISGELYDGFARAGLIMRDPLIRELMGYGGMLAEVGSVAGRRSRGTLTTLLIRNSAMLGFEPDEIDMIAVFARLCRGPIPLPRSKVYSIMPDPDQAARSAMILKLADIADRGRDGELVSVHVSRHSDSVGIRIVSRSDASMAVWKMQSVADEFKQIFGLELTASYDRI